MKPLNIFIIVSFTFLLFYCSHSIPKQVQQNAKNSLVNDSSKNSESVIDYSMLGSELMQNEKLDQLKIGLNAKDLSPILGSPSEESQPELWGADGLYHKTAKYSKEGVELDLIQNADSGFSVNMIKINAPCRFKTLKGIGINSDFHSVKFAYAQYIDNKEINENQIVAGSVYGGVIFTFENQKVKSIFIGASAE